MSVSENNRTAEIDLNQMIKGLEARMKKRRKEKSNGNST